MKITCSAPGKICLFGEHGIVYGKHSIACAINLRSYVSIQNISTNDSYVFTESHKYKLTQHPYFFSVFTEMKKIVDLENFFIYTKSQIPIQSGLGSSSSVIISLIQCLNKYYNCRLSSKEIANIGYSVEKNVQGLASPMDTYVSTFGGTIKFPEKKILDSKDYDIIVCNSMKHSETKKIVNEVNILKNKYPLIINAMLNTMDLISIEGEKALITSNINKIGELMNLNQGLLDSIGVSSKILSSIIYEVRSKGAFGSKITGSGGGGCIISLCNHSKSRNIVNHIKNSGYNSFVCKSTKIGVKEEINFI